MNRSGNIILIVFFSSLIAIHANSQTRECLTVQIDSLRKLSDPRLGASEEFEAWMKSHKTNRVSARTTSNTYYIPVVVHVVHNGEPVGEGPNISYEQVQSQIEVLNEDFRKKEGTNGFNTDPVGADTQIEFYLAFVDPDGNVLEEPGLDRVNGEREEWPKGILQNPIESQLKPATIWDPERYFNIWTVNFGGFIGRNLLGYAQFPDMSGLDGLSEDEGSELTDGIVIGYKYFGSSEKGDFPVLLAPFDLGRTTTHEVGHWLGLRHIWGDGNCLVDDFVEDTPVANEPTNGCPNMAFSCGVERMFENYMDYTNDGCMNIFTEGQRERMEIVLENSPRRAGLVQLVVGIPEQAVSNSVMIYPNPATSKVRVDFKDTSIQGITIMNTLGMKVDHHNLTDFRGENITIDTQDLSGGIYYVTLTSEQGRIVATEKLIIDK